MRAAPIPFDAQRRDCLVVLSGGQDSTTCLFWALEYFRSVTCITFDYGQRHSIELESARNVYGFAGSTEHGDKLKGHEVVTVGPILKGTSPLVNQNEELEQYADPESLPGGLEKTFVPMRNQMFLTLAANRAYVMGIDTLVTGVCQEDSGGYPDCTEPFIKALEYASSLGTFTEEAGYRAGLRIETPLMHLTKADSVHAAYRMGPTAVTALGLSHTAYDGKYPPTGKDHANLLREKGFAEAGRPDPLVLRAAAEGLMPMPEGAHYQGDEVEQVTEFMTVYLTQWRQQ